MFRYLTAILLFFQLSCTGPLSKGNSKATLGFPLQPLVIKDSTEDGWGADLRLSITQTTASDTGVTYRAFSSYKGQELGLTVFVPNKPEGDKGFSSGIILRSIGKESDALLQLLRNCII